MLRIGNRISTQLRPEGIIILVIWLYVVPLKWLLSWLVAVLIHELGHCMLLVIMGGQILSVRISSFGCKIESTALTPLRELICIIAGPFFALSILFLYRYIPRIAFCALVQSVYNLLPIYPLDGGRILRTLGKIRKTPCKQASVRVQ